MYPHMLNGQIRIHTDNVPLADLLITNCQWESNVSFHHGHYQITIIFKLRHMPSNYALPHMPLSDFLSTNCQWESNKRLSSRAAPSNQLQQAGLFVKNWTITKMLCGLQAERAASLQRLKDPLRLAVYASDTVFITDCQKRESNTTDCHHRHSSSQSN